MTNGSVSSSMSSAAEKRPTPPRVLVVEDNAELVTNLFAFLEPRNYSLDAAQNGVSGLSCALKTEYDAIILDWMLPRMSGPEMLKHLRDSGSAVPVIMLTARDELPDKIAGFKAGADDYLTKPFALAELEVRLEALIARVHGRKRNLQVADLCFDLPTQSITRAGDVLHLHAGCRKLLEILMRESPAFVSRERLEFALWGEDPPDGDMLRSYIYELRKCIDRPYDIKLLQTLPKHGYRLSASNTQ